jgi:transposase-like protein
MVNNTRRDNKIRRLHNEGANIAQICREMGICRDTVRKALGRGRGAKISEKKRRIQAIIDKIEGMKK